MAGTTTPTKKPRPLERSEFRDVEHFLNLLDELLVESPLWVEHAYVQLGAWVEEGPGPTIGLAEVKMDESGHYTVAFISATLTP